MSSLGLSSLCVVDRGCAYLAFKGSEEPIPTTSKSMFFFKYLGFKLDYFCRDRCRNEEWAFNDYKEAKIAASKEKTTFVTIQFI
jgi:hypothetical protein